MYGEKKKKGRKEEAGSPENPAPSMIAL
jgi:hypothetical protein